MVTISEISEASFIFIIYRLMLFKLDHVRNLLGKHVKIGVLI